MLMLQSSRGTGGKSLRLAVWEAQEQNINQKISWKCVLIDLCTFYIPTCPGVNDFRLKKKE